MRKFFLIFFRLFHFYAPYSSFAQQHLKKFKQNRKHNSKLLFSFVLQNFLAIGFSLCKMLILSILSQSFIFPLFT